MVSSPSRCRISSPYAGTRQTKSGAPGVGPTGAASLVERYGNLDAAIAAGRFPTMADTLRLYRSIATMDKKAPLPSLRAQKPTWQKASALARDWELSQLARRLDDG